VKRVASKKAQGKSTKRVSSEDSNKFISKKIKLILTSLIVSLVLFAFSWVCYEYVFLDNLLMGNFFFILSVVSRYLSVAFFIALLVFMILRAFRR